MPTEKGIKVLYVEDEPAIAELLKSGLDLSSAQLPELGRAHRPGHGHEKDGHLLGVEGNNQRFGCLVGQIISNEVHVIPDILFRFVEVNTPVELS